MPLRPLILPAEVGQLARPCYADEALLTQIIAESEREDIRPRIGATLFVALKSTGSDADLTGSLRILLLGGEWTDDSGRMHYLDGIKVALAYYTYGRVIRDGNITSTRYGAVIKSDDNSNSASDNAERQRQYRQAFDTADTMIVEAVNYITAMKVGGYEDCPGIRSNRAKMSVIGNHSASCGCESGHTTIISGKEGPSAYDVAVANGFRGSVEDWLASLVGPQGPEGPQGPQGPSVSLDDYYDKPEVDALLADKASASDVESAIREEAAARENGDQSLGTQIAALENNVGESIGNVEDKVDGVSASLAVVQSDLETEQAARVAADAALGTRISNEEAARKSSDDSLSESIAAEATKRGSEDSRIEGLIGIERNERAAADAALELSKQDAISDLETIRSNAQNASNTIASIVNAGYVFAGVATSSTNPGIPDAKVFYIANGKGTYEKFGGLEVTEDEVVVLYWDTAWHKVSTGIASQVKLSELEGKFETETESEAFATKTIAGKYLLLSGNLGSLSSMSVKLYPCSGVKRFHLVGGGSGASIRYNFYSSDDPSSSSLVLAGPQVDGSQFNEYISIPNGATYFAITYRDIWLQTITKVTSVSVDLHEMASRLDKEFLSAHIDMAGKVAEVSLAYSPSERLAVKIAPIGVNQLPQIARFKYYGEDTEEVMDFSTDWVSPYSFGATDSSIITSSSNTTTGGCHSWTSGAKTADNISFDVIVDNEHISGIKDMQGKTIVVKVTNLIQAGNTYNESLQKGVDGIKEIVTYTFHDGKMDVHVEFETLFEVRISHYYGCGLFSNNKFRFYADNDVVGALSSENKNVSSKIARIDTINNNNRCVSLNVDRVGLGVQDNPNYQDVNKYAFCSTYGETSGKAYTNFINTKKGYASPLFPQGQRLFWQGTFSFTNE